MPVPRAANPMTRISRCMQQFSSLYGLSTFPSAASIVNYPIKSKVDMTLSLASSLFGQNDKGDKGDKALTSLFESSSKLPAKRNLPPAESKKKRTNKEPESTADAVKSDKKRKREKTEPRMSSSADRSLAVTKKENATEKEQVKEKIEKPEKKRRAEENIDVIDQESSEGSEKASIDDQSIVESNEQEDEGQNDNIPSTETKDNEIDADAEKRTVFVGNLPLSITRKKLAFMFSRCGKVESTRIRSVAVKGVKLPPQSAGNQVRSHLKLVWVDMTLKVCLMRTLTFCL